MLQDKFRESSRIGNEYNKLLSVWQLELAANPLTSIKKTKINKSEHIQFNLMQLFNSYLDQIWKDSQNMLQCAQAWSNESTDACNQDAIFTVNILGLHLMKQSLQTRQELFSIVDQFNNTSFGNSGHNQQNIHSMHKFLQHNTSESDAATEEQYIDSYFNRPATINTTSANSSVTSSLNRPIRLTSSPSTPTMSQQDWSNGCANSFVPACNYSKYYPTVVGDSNNGDKTQHALSCHFCQEVMPLKKSFSVDNLYSLQQNLLDAATDDEEESNDTISEMQKKAGRSIDITSLLYYCSNSEEDEEYIMERELLLTEENGNDTDIIRQQEYQIIGSDGNMKESIKIEINDEHIHSGSSTSSSIVVQYDSTLKKVKRCRRFNYGGIKLSPASSLLESRRRLGDEEITSKRSSRSGSDIHARHEESPVYTTVVDEGDICKTTAANNAHDGGFFSTIFSKNILAAAPKKTKRKDKRHHFSKKKDNIKKSSRSSIMRSLSMVKINGIRNFCSSTNN